MRARVIPLLSGEVRKAKYEVEKGIEIPRARNQEHYPWSELGIGDSFFIPGKTVAGADSMMRKAARRHGIKCIIRTMEGGVRIWRIA